MLIIIMRDIDRDQSVVENEQVFNSKQVYRQTAKVIVSFFFCIKKYLWERAASTPLMYAVELFISLGMDH